MLWSNTHVTNVKKKHLTFFFFHFHTIIIVIVYEFWIFVFYCSTFTNTTHAFILICFFCFLILASHYSLNCFGALECNICKCKLKGFFLFGKWWIILSCFFSHLNDDDDDYLDETPRKITKNKKKRLIYQKTIIQISKLRHNYEHWMDIYVCVCVCMSRLFFNFSVKGWQRN